MVLEGMPVAYFWEAVCQPDAGCGFSMAVYVEKKDVVGYSGQLVEEKKP